MFKIVEILDILPFTNFTVYLISCKESWTSLPVRGTLVQLGDLYYFFPQMEQLKWL